MKTFYKVCYCLRSLSYKFILVDDRIIFLWNKIVFKPGVKYCMDMWNSTEPRVMLFKCGNWLEAYWKDPFWAPSHASHRYVITSFRSDHHVALCWLVKRSIILALYISEHAPLLIVKILFGTHESFALFSMLACHPNTAATLRAFRSEYYLWRPDWLKLPSWLTD